MIQTKDQQDYPICEIRIPTYRRPHSLQRALESLQNQTYPFWRAVVLDNSPDKEAEAVVEELQDQRIVYYHHPKNIGGTRNIDLALYPQNILGGKYACSLEDDNYLFPSCLQENIDILQRENVSILLRNQEIRMDGEDGVSQSTGETTRDKWFQRGIYSPLELYASLFFCEGLSNGGLFWDTETIRTDFTLGDCAVKDAWYQEILRTLRVVEPIYFEPTVGSAYTVLGDYQAAGRGSQLPKFLATPAKNNRATQAILRYMLKLYGKDLVEKADVIANYSDENFVAFEYQLLNALYTEHSFQTIRRRHQLLLLGKNACRRLFFKQHFDAVLKQMPWPSHYPILVELKLRPMAVQRYEQPPLAIPVA
ncbi:glycosyltransferase family 2 protein [Leptothoe kymatousa]|uniref:Glycosyltransferase family 2 protein n=1 Tax=Leptothoe kymatousa TAU-MAC 1615 TaxID=2364775 RepID=A0ABS5Y6U1_9CYAN|nr:glycosyltransferase family 2 protein [Leptothoe kymatousa]MBT9313491.1 glycosyltransferase family 2 protein [Leptothoe kymatousa TAU-MAC 1615]